MCYFCVVWGENGKERQDGMGVLNLRQEKIVQYLMEKNFEKAEVLAQVFQVSSETIRRDLKKLEDGAYIKRTHGGAQYDNLRSKEKRYEERMQRYFAEKKAIASEAARYVNNGDSLMLNTGTSTLELARALREKNGLTVITNSVDVANVIVENESNQVYLPGGILRKSGKGLSGDICCEFLSRFQVDKVFLSVGGLSGKYGVTEYHVSESAVMRKMIEKANKIMILGDCGKFNEVALNQVCEYSRIDYLFTDWRAPSKELLACREAGVKVIVAKEPGLW